MSNWKTITTAHLSVKGTVKDAPPFESFAFDYNAALNEMPEDDPFHYGTGCYLHVEPTDPLYMPYYLDVRYEGTRDIETLLRRWAEGHWGENADTITITVN